MSGFAGRVHDSWLPTLEPHAETLRRLEEFLDQEQAEGHGVAPGRDRLLRAFEQPLDDVRVVIAGQDPYPTPGHAIGLSFAVDRDVRPLPPSLRNIYRELHDDLGIAPAPHGDLSAWSSGGVLLLNRCLSVREGEAGSHRRQGWEQITAAAIEALAARGGPLVAILWGRDAEALREMLPDATVISSAHPSPLSARRGFFGSRPFSAANAALESAKAQPIDWRVER